MVKSITQLILCLSSSAIMAMPQVNLSPGVTPISHDLYELHMIIFYICLFIAIGVFAAMLYIMLKYRKSQGAKASHFHHNTWVEIAWTIVPALILVVMAIPATKVLIQMNDDSKAEINIKITGHQWYWEYSYLDENIKFFSKLKTTQAQINGLEKKGPWYLLEVDQPLIVPIHAKIRFLMTSVDVNHSWWVPELGVKKDAIPGLINTAWAKIDRPGIYRGQCTELCGMNHGFMPVVVIALPMDQYHAWVQAKHEGKKYHITLPTHPDLDQVTLMQQGKKLYRKHCAVCHQSNGKGRPPVYPSIQASSVATGPIRDHIHLVLHGKKGTAMQNFSEQLSNEEIASILTYQRNSWGNNDQKKYGQYAGGLIQAKDVLKVKQQGVS